MTHRDLASMNEAYIQGGYRRAARRRLRVAHCLMRKAQGRGRAVQRFAERELECATAEAQEWAVAGRVGAR